MRHFELIQRGIDVSRVTAELATHPELWNAQTSRRDGEGTPHGGMSDIWVRYNDPSRLSLGREAFNAEHVPVWYPAWDEIPALRAPVFDLMAEVQGEMLGGILITKIPPGHGIAPHVDQGWHVQYYEKFYLSLQSEPGADFVCDHDGVVDRLNPEPGEIWRFDNRKRHWVENNSLSDRVTLIICIRTEAFGER